VQVVQTALISGRRDVALGAPVVCAMLTQAGLATRDAAPAVPFGLSLIALVVAVALVYRGELLDESTVTSGSGTRAALLEAAAAPLMRVAVVAAVVFVLLPNSFHLSAHASTGSGNGGAAVADSGDPGDPGAHSRALVDPSTGRLDLRVRGALSTVPIFVVAASAPAYWQGAVYDHYDGVAWTMTGENPSSDWKNSSSTAAPVQKAPADTEQPAGVQVASRDDSVQLVSTEVQSVVFAPGRAVSYTGPGHVFVDVDGNPRLNGVPAGVPSSHDYAVTSTRPVVAPGQSGGPVGPAKGDTADARWTQVPAQLPARVRQLATQLTSDATNRAGAVAAIDNYLRSNETYDLSAPLPRPGDDAVDDFLFVSHVGFCEQFATAAVMLLRTVGIPARLVTGYAQGDVASEPGRRVMRGSDAHAWVQVWYPGTGWVDADPTSSAALGSKGEPQAGATTPTAGASASASKASSGSASSSADSSSSSASASAPASSSGSASASARAVPGLNRSLAHLPGGRFVLAVAIVALALLLRLCFAVGQRCFAVGRRWVRRRNAVPYPSVTRPPAGGPILQAYLRLDAALGASGSAGAAGETPREVLNRLGRTGAAVGPAAVGPAAFGPAAFGLAAAGSAAADPAAVASALALLEHECFGAEPPSRDDITHAVAVFDALCEAVQSGDRFAQKVTADLLT
jgi:protein-glutamine gamma-glutamyltransferase